MDSQIQGSRLDSRKIWTPGLSARGWGWVQACCLLAVTLIFVSNLGCQQHDFARDLADPDTIVLYVPGLT